MAASTCSKPALFLLSFVTLFLIASNVVLSVEAADRKWSCLQWAKEKLRVEVGIKKELAKEIMDKLLSRKQDFVTDAVSEGIHAIAKSVSGGGGRGGGGGGHEDKWASWMEWWKEKLKQVLEKKSDSAKAQLATGLDAAMILSRS